MKRKPTKRVTKPKYTPKQVKALMKKAIALYHAGENQAKQLGFVLIEVKDALKHGDFKKWLAAYQIDRNRASYAMRLANGKHKKAKLPYAPKPEKVAEMSIKRVVAQFVERVANKDGQIKTITLDEVSHALTQTIFMMVANVGKIRKWPVHDPILEPEVATAGDRLRIAVDEFLDAALKPITLDDLDAVTNATNPRISDYARAQKESQAKPPRTEAAGAGR